MFDTDEYFSELDSYEKMTFDTYQNFTPKTAVYEGNLYPLLGLMGEISELSSDKSELGDVMWYVSQTCNTLGLNMEKLFNLASPVLQVNLNDVLRLGEICKKSIRDGDFTKKPDHVAYVHSVLIHIVGYIKNQNVDLEVVMARNANKLIDRKSRGVIKGDGNER